MNAPPDVVVVRRARSVSRTSTDGSGLPAESVTIPRTVSAATDAAAGAATAPSSAAARVAAIRRWRVIGGEVAAEGGTRKAPRGSARLLQDLVVDRSGVEPGEQLPGRRGNHRDLAIGAGERPDGIPGLEQRQGHELHFRSHFAPQQIGAVVSGNAVDAGEYLVAEQRFVGVAFSRVVHPCHRRAIM